MGQTPTDSAGLISRRHMLTGSLALSLLPALAQAQAHNTGLKGTGPTKRLSFQKPATHMMEPLSHKNKQI